MKRLSAQIFSKVSGIVLLENLVLNFLTYFLLFIFFSNSTFSQTSITISSTGSGTFTVPCDVTSLTVQAWGGGGAGGGTTTNNAEGGGGGAGGTYVSSTLTVTPGQVLNYYVGAGANGQTSAGNTGQASWFNTTGTLYAQGGAGGAAPNSGTVLGGIGSIASSIGTIRLAGANGVNGTLTVGGAGGNGANFGGTGGNQRTTGGNGYNGLSPGGGGGGAFVNNGANRVGGNGGDGQIIITYTTSLLAYCATGYSTANEAITNVTFAGINNSTGANTTGGNHEYFCDTAIVEQSGTYTISVNGDTEGNYSDGVIAYFDWNQNGVFTDSGEDYIIGVLTNNNGFGTPVTANITVPSYATLGTTTMRVMKMYNAYPNSCYNSSGYGQTEDYLVNVTSPGYCEPSTTWANWCYIDDIQFVGTLNDVSKLNSSYGSNDGYQDWTSEPKAIQVQGEGINIIADAGGTRGAWKAWVDWNKNDQFEISEEVYNPGASLGTRAVFGFVIPDAQPPGDYRIRLRVGVNYWNWNGNGVFEYPDEEFYYDFDSCENFINTTYFGQADYYFGEAEDYLFTVIEKCDSYVVSVTDGEACGSNQTVDLSFEGAGGETVTGFNIYDSETNGSLIGTSGIVGSTGSWTTPAISTTTTYWVTATSACSNGESLIRIPVTAYISPIPTLSFSPSNPIVCGEDAIVEISANGDKETVYLIDEDFESGLGAFTNINNDLNIPVVNNITQWQIEASTHNSFTGNVWSPAISSGVNNNQFAMATSDHISSITTLAKPVDNSITLTTAVNTTDFTSLVLSFDMFYLRYLPDNYNDPTYEEFVDIDISTNNGGSWTTLERLDEDLGYGTSFINKTYDLFALGYNDVAELKIRIRHYSWADDASGFSWMPDGVAIDNVKLFGEKPLNTAFDWNITADAFIDAGATTQYISGTSAPVSTIYVKPLPSQLQSSTSFTFTASAILNNGCSASTDIIISNNTKFLKNPTPDRDWDDPNNWLPGGVPTADNCVIIPDETRLPNSNGIPPVGYDGFAKNLTIKSTGDLTIFPDNHLTVTDWIRIESGGVLDVKSGANLIQVKDVTVNENSGEMSMERTVNGLSGTDYVYWSSPVNQFNVQDISSATNSELIYQWIPSIGNNYGNWQSVSGNMAIGKGYIVRGLQTTSPANTAKFSGIPNNGLITNVPIQRGRYGLLPIETGYYNSNGVWVTPEDDNWNLIGNPYPSSISANKFTNDNPNIDGTIYLWTHASDPSTTNDDPFYDDFVYNYNPSDYIEHNNTGSNPPGTNDLYIASGQAFFVLMLDNATQNEFVTFSNTMRNKNYSNSNFYGPNFENDNLKTNKTSVEKHRIWLDLITSDNLASSILIGYVDGATNGNDRLYDGYEFAGSELSFYSLFEEDKMSIQGKALPFLVEDTVPLGLVIPKTENYKIAINTLDGLFENENQDIYIEDTYTNIIHNLRTSPYSFNSAKGTFNDRFILRYTNETLSINGNVMDNDVRVITFDSTLKITSSHQLIKDVKIIDVQGRLINNISNIDKNNYINNQLNISNGTYIVKVTLGNGREITKKVIF